MSEEEKATTPAADEKANAPAEAPQEESTAEFAPVVRLSFVVVSCLVWLCFERHCHSWLSMHAIRILSSQKGTSLCFLLEGL